MKLLLLSVGSVLASSSSPNNKLSSLVKACGKDYEQHCSNVDKSNLVTVLACGKNNQADLQPACLAEIQKDFPAVFACVEDLSANCPSFGEVSIGQWGNDDDDDDDSRGKKNHPHSSPPASSQPHPSALPASEQSSSAPLPPPMLPVQPLKPDVPLTNEVAATDPAPSNEEYDYFVFDFYFNTQETATTTAPSSNMNALHGRTGPPQEAQQCFVKSYPTFSAPCLNAITEQWATEQTAKGVKNISAPSAEEAYSMMAVPPPVPRLKKLSRTLFYVALAFFVCTLVTCLCCCCRRCKKRRSTRVVPEGAQEMALAPLPEAVAVPMAGPTRYVPLAVPVPPVVRPQTPSYIPYTGEGLSSYVPVAQPVHV